VSHTYNPNLVADTHKVRFRLQDTDSSKSKVQDEEVLAMLGQVGGSGWPTALRAAARIARSLHVRYGMIASVSALGTSVAYKDRSYLELAKELEQEAEGLSTGAVAMPFIGGISKDQKLQTGLDADRVEPFARVGAHDTDNFTTRGG